MREALRISPEQRRKLEQARDMAYELFWDLEANHWNKSIKGRAETILSKLEQLAEDTYAV